MGRGWYGWTPQEGEFEFRHPSGIVEGRQGDVPLESRLAAWIVTNEGLEERTAPLKFLVHDRDSKYSARFDEVFRTESIRVIHTPIRAPRANAFAERWVRTVRAECLDWTLILGRRHLERVLRTYATRYNRARPHRGLDLASPEGRPGFGIAENRRVCLIRRDILGGLIHEYQAAA